MLAFILNIKKEINNNQSKIINITFLVKKNVFAELFTGYPYVTLVQYYILDEYYLKKKKSFSTSVINWFIIFGILQKHCDQSLIYNMI